MYKLLQIGATLCVAAQAIYLQQDDQVDAVLEQKLDEVAVKELTARERLQEAQMEWRQAISDRIMAERELKGLVAEKQREWS